MSRPTSTLNHVARDRLIRAVQGSGTRHVLRLAEIPIRVEDLEDALAGGAVDVEVVGWLRLASHSAAVDILISGVGHEICPICGVAVVTKRNQFRDSRWEVVGGQRRRHVVRRCERARDSLEQLSRGYDARLDAWADAEIVTAARALLARCEPRDWKRPTWWRDAPTLLLAVVGYDGEEGGRVLH